MAKKSELIEDMYDTHGFSTDEAPSDSTDLTSKGRITRLSDKVAKMELEAEKYQLLTAKNRVKRDSSVSVTKGPDLDILARAIDSRGYTRSVGKRFIIVPATNAFQKMKANIRNSYAMRAMAFQKPLLIGRVPGYGFRRSKTRTTLYVSSKNWVAAAAVITAKSVRCSRPECRASCGCHLSHERLFDRDCHCHGAQADV